VNIELIFNYLNLVNGAQFKLSFEKISLIISPILKLLIIGYHHKIEISNLLFGHKIECDSPFVQKKVGMDQKPEI
jgi:hypothetical protein